MIRRTVAIVVLGLPIGSELPGQGMFTTSGLQHFPLDDINGHGSSLVDLDGDGDLDVVTGTDVGGTRHRFYQNDGHGVFRSVPAWPDRPTASAGHLVVDFDSNGWPDILVAGVVLLNHQGVLSSLAIPVAHTPMAYGDMDGDGHADLLARHGSGLGVSLWRRLGNSFVAAPASSYPTAGVALRSAALHDFDGDGDRDLLLATDPYVTTQSNWSGVDRLWRNDGVGNFSNVWLPGAPNAETPEMVAADFDGDGDIDSAALVVVPWVAVEWRLRLNDGLGGLTTAIGNIPPTSFLSSFRAHDLDGDGDVDLVAANHWLENDGVAHFTRRDFDAPAGRIATAGDVDGDGDVDLVVGGESNRLLLDAGGQQFVNASALPLEGLTGITGVGDVDADGYPDLLANAGEPLFVNDGSGWFAPTSFPWLDSLSTGVHFADADGDGDLDALFTSSSSSAGVRMRLCRNDGHGVFVDDSPGNTPTGLSSYTIRTAVLDTEGDGDPDFVVATQTFGLWLYENDGTGRFALAPAAIPVFADRFTSLAVGDFDRDGDSDLLAGYVSWTPVTGAIRYLENDGSGAFADVSGQRLAMPPGLVWNLVTGDVDGDQDLDVMVGCWGTSSYPNSIDLLLRNDGTGRLTNDPGRLPPITPTGSLATADIDEDGDLDLIAGTYLQGLRVWENDGTGTFADVGALIGGAGPHTTARLVLTDVDGDADADLLVDGRLLCNAHWHAAADFLARPGQPFALRFGARSAATGSGSVWQFFGGIQTAIPLAPFGTLAVLPQAAFVLPPEPLTAGQANLTHLIPHSPALVGLRLVIQAWLDAPAGGHLSPPVIATITS